MLPYAIWQLDGEVTSDFIIFPPNFSSRLLWSMAILKCKGSDRLEDTPVQLLNLPGNSPHW